MTHEHARDINSYCDAHGANCTRISYLEGRMDKIDKAVETIRNWIVAGMGTLIMTLIAALITFILNK